MRILMRREGAESSIFNAPPINRRRRRSELFLVSLPYQLDQVLELIRLRVEVVDQKGLELLCGAVVGGGWKRGRGWEREREVRGGGGEKTTKNPSCRVCRRKSSSLHLFVPRSSGYLSRGGMALSFVRSVSRACARMRERVEQAMRSAARERARTREREQQRGVSVSFFSLLLLRKRKKKKQKSSWLSSSS